MNSADKAQRLWQFIGNTVGSGQRSAVSRQLKAFPPAIVDDEAAGLVSPVHRAVLEILPRRRETASVFRRPAEARTHPRVRVVKLLNGPETAIGLDRTGV